MTALGRLFGSLANTLLDLGLPRIRAWLRERVGPAADVAQVSTEGSFIHLDGVRLPIGDRGMLSLARATAELTGLRGGGLGLPEVRLHAFRGVLRFGDEARGDQLLAEVVFAASQGTVEAAWVSGELTIVRATWSASDRGEGAPVHAPMDGRARLVVTSTAWSLEDGTLSSEHARVRFAGRGATDASAAGGAIDEAALVLDGARVGPFVDAVQAVIGRALAGPLVGALPLDARLSGELAWSAASGGKCNLHIVAEGSRAQVTGTVASDGRALNARLEGEISPALPMGRARVPAALLPRERDRLVVAIDAKGEATKPDVHATLRAPELGFRFGRPRYQPALLVRDVDLTVDIEAEVARVHGTARVGTGTLAVDGELPLRSRSGRRLGVKVSELEPSWLGSVLSVLAPEVRIALPIDARLGCELTLALEGATSVSGEVTVTTPRSRVSLKPLVFARRAGGDANESRALVADGTQLVGSLAAADALTGGLFPSDVRPEPSGCATLDLGVYGPLDDLVLSGLVTAPALRIAVVSRPEIPSLVVVDVATTLTVDRRGLTFANGRFCAYGGTFVAEGTVPFEPLEPALVEPSPAPVRLELRARDASAALIEAVAAFGSGGVRVRAERDGARPAGEVWLPRASRISGELRVAADLSLAAEIALDTSRAADLAAEAAPSTALLATLVVSADRRLDGSTVRGTVAVADAVVSGAFAADLRPLPDGSVTIDATLAGLLDDCVVAGFVTTPRLRLALHDGARVALTAPTFVVTDLTTMFRVDSAKTMWNRLEARAYGGTLASAGVVGYGGAFVGLQADVSARDVSAGHLPTDPGGTPLAEIAYGRLSLDMRFDRAGRGGPVTGRGQARLDEGVFPVLARARPALGRYGLTPPAETAVGPATLTLRLGPLGWSFSEIWGAVPGCTAAGEVRIGNGGRVEGALVVTLGQELLSSSAVLVVPSILAERLTVPVTIGGTLARPKVDADLGACLGRFVTDNRVTAIFSEAASDVVSLFTGREPAKATPTGPPEGPAVVARGAAEPLAEDTLRRELAAADADWDAIEARLEAHRRGGIRHRIG